MESKKGKASSRRDCLKSMRRLGRVGDPHAGLLLTHRLVEADEGADAGRADEVELLEVEDDDLGVLLGDAIDLVVEVLGVAEAEDPADPDDEAVVGHGLVGDGGLGHRRGSRECETRPIG